MNSLPLFFVNLLPHLFFSFTLNCWSLVASTFPLSTIILLFPHLFFCFHISSALSSCFFSPFISFTWFCFSFFSVSRHFSSSFFSFQQFFLSFLSFPTIFYPFFGLLCPFYLLLFILQKSLFIFLRLFEYFNYFFPLFRSECLILIYNSSII